jgi:hypothetical protein
MRRIFICFLIYVVYLGSSCVFFAEQEIKTEQAKITSIHPENKYIEIKVNGKSLKMHIGKDIIITGRDEETKFSDLNVGDSVEVQYVSEKTFGLWDYGGPPFLAKVIRVLE